MNDHAETDEGGGSNVVEKPGDALSDAPGDALSVYTDGACVHPGTKRHAGVYSVFISEGHPRNAMWFTRDGHVTNQTMELAAAHAGLEAIDAILTEDAAATAATAATVATVAQPTVYTASSYVMSCMIKWLPRWERTGWITKQRRAVQNGELLRKMAEIKHRRDVRFEFVSIVDLIGARSTIEADRLPQRVRDGMANARQLLVDATSSTGGGEAAASTSSTTGCSKRRNVLCTWMGG